MSHHAGLSPPHPGMQMNLKGEGKKARVAERFPS